VPSEKPFKILSLNTYGVMSKIEDPYYKEFLRRYDIIGLTETLTDSIPASESLIMISTH